MEVKIKLLHPAAKVPTYATAGAACFDIYAIQHSVLVPGSAVTLDTGLSFEVPEGHVMRVFSRSGMGFKDDVRLSNCVGVIDCDYRGELRVKLRHDGSVYYQEPIVINPGDRIAQAEVTPIERALFLVSEELSETARGAGGFGSSGK